MDGAFEPTAFNSDAFDVSDIVWNTLNTNQTPGWQVVETEPPP
jgi:hypothetical protein